MDCVSGVGPEVALVRGVEVVAPVLGSVTVDGTGVVLAFDKALDESSVPAGPDFEVSVRDWETGAVSQRPVSAVSIDDNVASLTLDVAVRSRDVVTVSYWGGSNPIRGSGGLDATSVDSCSAVNNTVRASDASLAVLELAGGELSPQFVPATRAYTASVDNSVTHTTVRASATDLRAWVFFGATVDVDGDPHNGHQVALAAGVNTITVTVTAEDSATTSTYTVTVTRAHETGEPEAGEASLIPAEDAASATVGFGATGGETSLSGVDSVSVRPVRWSRFDNGVPAHHNAGEAQGWLLTSLRYALNEWWFEFKDFDAQDSRPYLDFSEALHAGSASEQRYGESAAMALALAVALQTGAYDESVTGVGADVARRRALKLVQSLAYRHHTNAPAGSSHDSWGNEAHSVVWATHVGYAAWLLWPDLSRVVRRFVKRMILAEASEYRSPLYHRDRSGDLDFTGSKTGYAARNAALLSLAATMMPDHPDADLWNSRSIQFMLSAYSRPTDTSSAKIYHGHALKDWLGGSNINTDGTATVGGVVHPDHMTAGVVELNPVHIYHLAKLSTPQAAKFNADKVTQALIELEHVTGPSTPNASGPISSGPFFRAGTLCEGDEANECKATAEHAGETFENGHSRGCLAGPPRTDTNVFYPDGSGWSTKHRSNLAMLAAQVDVYRFDTGLDDDTLRGDYWFSCFVRDVRAMQARHLDGRTWNNSDNYNFTAREGQSAYYAAQSWLAYWIEHQLGIAGTRRLYANNPAELEFDRITSIEAEDDNNTLGGSVEAIPCDSCSGGGAVALNGTGSDNALTMPNIHIDNSGIYRLYIIYSSNQHHNIALNLPRDGHPEPAEYQVSLPALDRHQLAVAQTNVHLAAGDNDLTIFKPSQTRGEAPAIDRVVLGPPDALSVAPTLTMAEGTSQDLAVTLLTEPSQPLKVTVDTSHEDLSATPATLTFTAANWEDAQTIEVTADEDPDTSDNSHSVTLSYLWAGSYPGQSAVAVHVTDNDTYTLVAPTTLRIAQGSVADLRMRLSAPPSGDVAVTATASNTRIGATPAPTTFTPSNWRSYQTLEVWATDPGTATLTLTYSGGGADPGHTDVAVTVTETRQPRTETTEPDPDPADTTAPQLLSASVDGTQLTLTYNETLDTDSTPSQTAFAVTATDSITAATSTPTVSTVDITGAEVTLTLATAVRNGDTVTVSYTVPDEANNEAVIQDTAGLNAATLATQAVTNNTAAASDATLSVLALADAGGTLVTLTPTFEATELTYSASVAHETTSVTVTAEVTDSRASVALPADDDNTTAGVQVDLTVGANAITVTVTAEDGSTTGAYTVTVSRADETDPPQLSSATVDGAELTLTYSETLDSSSEPATSAFAVSVTDSVTSTTSTPAVSTVDVSGAEVTLTLAAGVHNGDTVTVSYTVPDETNNEAVIQDTAGLNAAALSSQAVTNNTAAASDATLQALGLTDLGGTAVALTPAFEATKTTYAASVANEVAVVTVTATGADDRAGVVVAPADSDTDTDHHQAALAEALAEASTTTVTVTVTAEDSSTTGTYTVTVTRAADTTAPSLSSATVDATALVLTYDEALDTASEPATSAFAVTVDDSATAAADPVAVTVTAVDVTGAAVTLTLGTAVRFGDTVAVSYTVPDETNGEAVIQDLAGLNAAALSSQSVTNATTTASDATLSSLAVTAGETTLSLTPAFDAAESSYSASVVNAVTSVTVAAATTDARASVALPTDDDTTAEGVQVNLDVGANTVTVTVTAEDGSTTGAYTVTVSRADETNPPQLTTATVDGTDLVLVYSEALNAGSEPAVGDFAVSVTDSVTSVEAAVAVSTVDVDGSDVELTLAAAVRHGDTVTFDYTPGTDPVQDTAANPAASLDDQAVTNNTAAAADAKLDVLSLTDAAGTAVALSPTFGSVQDTTSTYTAQVVNEVAVVTVTATGTDDRAAVVIAPADSDTDTDHHQAALAEALAEASTTTVTVTVTAEDSSTTGTYTVTVTRAADTTAPSLSSATVDATALVLTYDEALDTASEPATSAFAVTVDDSATAAADPVAVTVTAVDVTGAAVTLTLGTAVRFGDTVAVSYTVPDETNGEAVIQDLAGLNAAALSSQSVTNATTTASDATLSSLAVTAGETTLSLTPAFDAAESSYSASVVNAVTSVTVAAATTDARASVALPTDDDTTAEGVQVNLDVGANTVTVTVTAEDGSTTGAYTITVSRADETNPPQLTTATVDGTDLVLVYSESLNAGSEPAAGDFAVSVTDSVTSVEAAVAVSTVDVDGSDVELTLAAAVRHGDTVTLDYTPGTDPVQDAAANPAASLDDQAVTNNTAAAADAKLDVLSLTDAAGTAVALSPTFGSVQDTTSTYTAQVVNEVAVVTVTATGADDRAAVVIAPADSDTDTDHHQAALAEALAEASTTTVTVTVTAEDSSTTGTYTVTVTRAADTTAPSLSSATVDATALVLTYDEALDTASEPAVGAFSVSVTDSVTSTTATPAVSDVDVTGADVKLTLGAAVRFGDTVAVSYTVPDETNGEAVIQDLAGLNAAALSSQSVTNATAKASDAKLSALALSAGETALTLTPAFDAAETTYSASVVNEVTSVTVTAAVTDSRASVALPTDDDTVTDGVQVNLTVGANAITVTVTAEDNTTGTYTVTVSRADETNPPQLSSATVDGTDLVLVYSEALNSGSKPAVGDFAVSVTDSATSATTTVAVSTVNIDGSDVELTLAAAVRNNDTVAVSYTPGTDPVQDTASNPAAALSSQAVTNTTAAASDATLDVLALADAAGAAVALSPTFGSPEDTTGTYTASVANEVAAVTVTATGADTRAAVVVSPADADADTEHHQAALAAALAEASTTTVTVTVTAEDSSTTGTYTVTVTRAADTTAPSLASATVNGADLVLAYGEALDTASEPATSAFSVTVDDSATAAADPVAATVDAVDVTGADVKLTLGAAVRFGDTVTVSYVVPDEANNEAVIEDLAGLNAAALSSQSVTNATAKAADATLGSLAVAVGETALTLTPAFDATETTYSASVAFETTAVTVTAAVADSRASVTLPTDDDSVTDGVQVDLDVGANAVTVTVIAEDNTTAAYTVTVSRADETNPPQLSSATVDGADLVLVYSEALNSGSKPAAGDFAVSVTDSATSATTTVAVSTVNIDGSDVELTLAAAVRNNDTVAVSYTPGTDPVQDTASNNAAALASQAVTNTTAAASDATLDVLALADAAGAAVALSPTFGSPEDTTGTYTASVANEVAVVTVTATGADTRAAVVVSPADSDTDTEHHQAALAAALSEASDTTITVTVTAEDTTTTDTYTITVTRAPDTTAPSLSTATVDGTELTLTYSETLDTASEPATSAFSVSVTDSVTSTTSTPAVSTVDVTGADVKLTLAAAVRNNDTVEVTYVVPDEANNEAVIEDLAGLNAAALSSQTVTNATAKAADATLSALAVAVGETALTLTPAFDATETSYSASVVNEVTSVTVTAAVADSRASVTLPTDDDSVTEGVQVDLDVGTNAVTVTVTAEDNTTAAYTVTVSRADETNPPQLSSAAVDGTDLVLVYSEALDADSQPAVGDFAVTVVDSATSAEAAVAVTAVAVDGSDVELTLATAVRHGDTVTFDYTPGTNPVRDAAANPAAALASQAVTNNTAAAADATLDVLALADAAGTAVALSPVFGSPEDTDGTYTASVANDVAVVTVTATGTDDRAGVVVAPADSDTDTEHHQAALDAALSEASDTTVTVTVTAEDTTTTDTYTITVTRAPDTTAPSLSTATVDGTELTLTYSETLDTASEPATSAFSVSVTDSVTSTTSTPAVSDVDVTGADVTLTLGAAVRNNDTVTVSYTVPDEANNEAVIQDPAGLNAAALSSQSVTNATAKATDATLAALGLTAGGATLTLTPAFDATETTYSASVAFEVTAVTVTVIATTDSRAQLTLPADDDSVAGGLQVNLDVGDNAVTVTVIAEDNTTAAYTVTVSRADETNPPQLTTATVDGTDLTLTYNEALNTGSEPAVGDFAVSVVDSGTSAEAAVTVTAVDVDGSDVELTLAAAVRHGDTVTFDYTPGTDPIQDLAANPAAALDDQAATNTTAAASDATLDVLSLADAGGAAVALSPTFGSPEDTTSTYTASVANEVAAVTVTATGVDDRAAVVIAPADSDADTEHHQAALAAALTEASDTAVTVTVTAEDTTTTRTYTITVTRAADTTAPSLSTATVDGTDLVLTYSEALDTGSEPDKSAFSVSVTDSVTSTTATAAVTAVDVTGADVVLTLAAAVRYGDTVTVSYTVPDETNGEAVIEDLAGLNAAALASQSVTNATAAAADATLSALAVSAGETALTLTPAFDAAETTYSASVTFEVQAVTVTAAVTDSRASLTLPTDDDFVTGGVQVNLQVGANTVTVTVTAEDGSTTGTYTVTVSRADETNPPQLSTATVDGTDLTLTYNEALNSGSEPAVGDFAVSVVDSGTSAEAAVSVTAVDVDGSDVELTLAAAVRSGDTVTFDYTPGTDPIQDLAANPAAALDDQAATNTTAAASDATLDVLALADAAGAAVALSPTFGSPEDTTSTYTASVANEVAAVTVTATGADTRAAVVIAPADSDTDTAKHQAALDAALTEASDTTVTVTVTAEDTTTTRTYTITVTRAADTTAPSLSTATVDGTELTLTYSEALDTGSEPDKSAFSVSVTNSVTSATSTPAVTAVDVTGAEVTLTLGAAVRYGDTVTVSYTVPDEANSEAVIEDLAGLNAAALASQSVTNATAAAADATLSALAVSAGETALTLTPAFDATETTYSASVTHETTAVTVAATTTDSRASVTLPTDDDSLTEGVQINLDVGDNTVTVTVTAEDGSTTGAYTVTVSRADETDPPQLSTATVDGTDMTLTYSEALNTGSKPAAGDFAASVTDSGTSAVSAVSVTAVDVDGTEVTLTLAAAVRSGDTVTVDYTPGTDPIEDLAANPAAALDDQAVTNNTANASDATLQTLALADAGGTAVALSPVFGSVQDTTSTYTAQVANEVAQVTVTATGVDDRAAVVIAPADSDTDTDHHQVDLAAALAEASDTTITATVTAEDTTTTRTYTITVTRAADTTAPSLASATVDGTDLTLTYSEALDTGSEPATSAFSVTVDDSATAAVDPVAVTVDAVAISGVEVTLTLAAAVRYGDTVTVSYTVPDETNGEAVIEDLAGLNAAALASQTVTNNTAKATDATLSALAVSVGADALSLSPAFEATELSYTASVTHETTAVTVAATTTDSRASVTLPTDDDSLTEGVQVNLDVGDNTVSVTVTAEDGSTTGAYTVTVSRADETDPPQLSTATVDGTELTLVYSEALNTGSEPAVGDFAVSVTDSVTSAVSAVAVTAVNVDGSDVELTLADAVRSGDTVTFDYTPGTDPIQDAAANDAAALDDQAVTNTTAAASDATLDVLSLADAGGAAVALSPTFGSPEDTTSTYTASVANEVAAVTVTATGADTRAAVVIAPADSDTDTEHHQAALAAALTEASDTTITVTVTAEDTTTTRAYTITVTRAADTTAPSLASATVDGADLTLAYSEALDADSEPDKSAFSVSVTNSVTSATSTPAVTAVDVTGAEVTLTLGAAVRYGDTVTVSYTVPDETNGEAVIEDLAGLNAAALASQSVTNATAKAADATLSALAVSVGADALSLSPAFEATESTYSASVTHETTAVTVAATTTDSRASVTLPTDDDSLTEGVQVNLDVGDNTVSVTVTAEDGSTTGAYTVTVSRADETDPPQLSTATVDGTDLTLTYSEALNAGSKPAAGDFAVSVTDSVTSAVSAVSVTAVDVDGTEVTLTLAAAVRSGDTVTFDYTPGTDPIEDLAANPAAGLDDQAVTNNTAKATDAKLDVLALADAGGAAVALSPVFGSPEDTTSTYTASVANEVAVVTVTATGADTRAAVVIAPADSDTDTAKHQAALDAALAEASDTTVTVTVTAEDTTTTGTYTITVTRAPDTTAPSLSTATVDGTELTLTYSEALDTGSEPATSAFSVTVDDSATAAVDPVAVTVDAVAISGVEVTLTLAAAVRNNDTVAVSYTVPDETNNEAVIEDTAGLNAAALASQAVTNNTAEATDATLSALAVSVGADALSLSPAFEATELSYTASVTFEVQAVTVTAAVTDSRASVALPTDDDSGADGVQVNLTVGDNTVTVTVTAEDGSTTGAYTVTVSRADETNPPQLSTATVDGTELTLVYNEALNAGSEPAAGDFAVSVTDSVTSVEAAVSVSTVAISGTDVTLTLATAVRSGDTVTFDYTPGTDPIQDAASNPAASLDDQTVTNNTAAASDAKLDVLALADGTGTAVALSPTFGSPEDTTSTYTASVANEVAAVTVTATGADTRAAVVIAPADSDTDTEGVQVELAAALAEASTTTVTVTVTAEDTTTTRTYTITVTRAPDTTAPSLASATVDGTQLTLTYSEALDTGSEPAVSAFSVSVTDSVTSTTSTAAVSDVDVTGAEVKLTLGAAVRNNDTVTVSYTVPDEANNEAVIQDTATNNAAALSSQTVTNNTAEATDATLSALAVSVGADALSLSPAFEATELSYTASVAFEVQAVTVTAAVTDSRASVTLPTDDDSVAGGVQVNLTVGANTVSVTVTAEDGSTTGAYTVTVSRAAKPQLDTATVDGASLVLGYDKTLDESSKPAVSDFVVSVTDSVTSVKAAVMVATVDIDGSDVTLTLSTPVRFGDTVTVTYTPGTSPVQVGAGTLADALSNHTVANNTAGATDTTLSQLGLSYGEDAVTLTPVFAADKTTYSASVGYDVTVVTVYATTTDVRASWEATDDDTETGGYQVDLDVGDTTVTVTVTPEDGETTGTYTIAVTRAAKPQLDTATANGASLVLSYDKTLDEDSLPAGSDFAVSVTDSVTGVKAAVTVAQVDVAAATVTLTLSTPVRFGDTVTVTYTPGDDPIQVGVGTLADALASQTVTNNTTKATDATLESLALTAGDDAVALSPAFEAAETTYSASVVFEVQAVTVTAAAMDSRASVSLPTDDDTVTEGVQVDLDVGANTVTVTVTAEDGSTAVYTVTATRANETDPPQLSTATVDGTELTLTYNEALNESSQPAASDFAVSVTDAATSSAAAVSVTAVNVDGSDVELTLATAVRHDDTVSFDYTPGTNPIQDLATNNAAALSSQAVTNNTAAATDATLTALGLTELGGTAVALSPTFGSVEDTTGTYTASVANEIAQVTVTATGTDTRAAVVIAPADADTDTDHHQIDLAAALSEASDTTITVTVTAEDNTTTATYTITVTRAADAPQLSSATVTGTNLTLTYSEALDADSEPATSAFTVSVTDSVTSTTAAVAVASVDVTGADVTLTLASPVRNGDTVTVSYTVGDEANNEKVIQDTAGLNAAALSSQAVTNNTTVATDATLAALALADGEGAAVALSPVFGSVEDTDGTYTASVANEVAFVTVTATGADTRAAVVVSPADADTDTEGIQAALAAALAASSDTTVTVTVTAEDTTTTATYTITVTRAPDTTAPSLSSATVDGTALTLTYGDALDETSEPAAGDFSVSVVDSVTSATSTPAVTDVDVTGAVVTLTLAAAVRHGDTVTVDYTAGANPIRDLATNNAAALDDKAVTNVTVAASDATLSVLSLADAGGAAVALSPTFDAATVSYSASVAYEVVWVSLAAAAADSRASVVVEPADGDSVLADYQLWPVVGANTVTVTVTAEDELHC